MKTGKLVQKYRIKSGINQRDLGIKLGLMGAQYISNLERNKCCLAPKHAKAVSKIIGVPFEELKAAIIEDKMKQIESEFK